MRIFFLFLVALNAVFFVAQWYQSEDVISPQFAYEESVIPADDVEPIYLIGELNLEETASQAGESKLSASADAAIQTHPVAQLTELATQELASVEEQDPKQPDIVAQLVEKCAVWGPYHSESHVKAIQKKLSNRGLEMNQRSIEVNQLKGYWLYFPPFKNIEDARAYSKKLKAKGIDNYVLIKGENRGGLSLGFFKTKRRAEEYQEELIAKGYNALGDEYRKPETQYWLQVMAPSEARLVSSWKLVQSLYPNAKYQSNPCEGNR